MHVTIRSVAGHAAATVPPADELVLGKLACQAGFVISFYDLSSPIPGPSVHCCTDEAPTGSRPLDGQPIDKTEGSCPLPPGAAPSNPQRRPRRKSAEGLGGYDA